MFLDKSVKCFKGNENLPISTPTLTQRLTPPNTKVTAVSEFYSTTPLFPGVGLALLSLFFLKIAQAVGLCKGTKVTFNCCKMCDN